MRPAIVKTQKELTSIGPSLRVQVASEPVGRWLSAVFLLSGFAALVYQVVWQRLLFVIYGINIESVTVVVTAFMLGLGIGSILGGALSKDPRRPVLLLFSLVELGIGAFGFLSLPLFNWVGSWTLLMPPAATALVTFLLLLVPTLLMGATLPLLVAYTVRRTGNVGRSVGGLYCVNTMGSALAALATAVLLLGNLGLMGSVILAGVVNTGVGLFVLSRYLRGRRAS